MRLSPLLAALLLPPTVALANGAPRTYIKCDKPVTCAVSYSEDLVALELHADETCAVEVWTGFAPQWCLVDGERTGSGWSANGGDIVLVQAQAGSVLFEFGRGRWPLRGDNRPVPLKLDGKRKGQLRTTYWPRRMEARGAVELPLGLYEVTMVLGPRLRPKPYDPKLRVGPTVTGEWDDVLAMGGRPGMRAAADVVVGGEVGLHLTWRGDFVEHPVREIQLRTVTPGAELAPVEAPDEGAEGAIVVEAEDYTREGNGGPVQVSEGEHADQHGGASIYSFGPGEGHWVQWEFDVRAAGRYALYARTATQEAAALRTLTVDREKPYPEAGLLSFPGTGGWAREDPKQWVWTCLAGAEGRPALTLDEGSHKIRLRTQGDKHLNVDVLVLAPVN